MLSTPRSAGLPSRGGLFQTVGMNPVAVGWLPIQPHGP
jgi:hypothetical protein